MRPVVLCLCCLLCIYLPMMDEIPGALGRMYLTEEPPGCSLKEEQPAEIQTEKKTSYTPMEALDLIKERYAANFVQQETDSDEYYYKLPSADYYLVYEGYGVTEEEYIIHLYEFVLDNPEEGIGHTVTYAWYRINRNTGITEQ